jgi:hypothetical protein
VTTSSKNRLILEGRIWSAVKSTIIFLILLVLGFALSIYLVINGARPPVDPLSLQSWANWWRQDPRSAASLSIASLMAAFGFFGTFFQLFISDRPAKVRNERLPVSKPVKPRSRPQLQTTDSPRAPAWQISAPMCVMCVTPWTDWSVKSLAILTP